MEERRNEGRKKGVREKGREGVKEGGLTHIVTYTNTHYCWYLRESEFLFTGFLNHIVRMILELGLDEPEQVLLVHAG